MKPELSLIKEIFDSHFMNWNIFLDPEAIRDRRRGKILEAGWTIWFLFGINEKGEYLDYYSNHRMTNDHHCRIYEDGSLESLPSFWEFYSYSKPDEREERKREFYEHNQEVEKILSDKGFTLDGSEYGSLLINRYLLTNNDEDDSADR